MIVLDTHAWLWWTAEPRKLSRRARAAIDSADRIGVCTISCYEVAALSARDRITLNRSARDWVAIALAQARIETLELDATAAVEAALLHRRSFPGDPADRIIYATARANRTILVTKDARLRRFDREGTIW